MDYKVKKEGLTLYTKDKYLEEDIQILPDESVFNQDYTMEDALITRTFTNYSNERVKSIGYRLFYMYTELTAVNIPNAETIGSYAFYGCTGLTEVSFPKVVTVDTNGFNACTKLKVAKLPLLEKVVEIFRNDTSLEVVYLPKATSFAGGVFADDTNLKALILDSDVVANLQSTSVLVRSGIANGTGYVYVRDSLVDSYKTATNWTTYATQIKGLSELPQDVKEELGL